METLLGILASLFAGVNIFQFIFIRAQRKKAGAEASQEGAKADGMNLDNLKKLTEVQGELLLKSAENVSSLSARNAELESMVRKYDWEIDNLKRVVTGLQKMWNDALVRMTYAENNICLNSPCKDRIPTLGTYKHRAEEKNG